MKVWITKYALTQGMFEADVELERADSGRGPSMVVLRGERDGGTVIAYFHGEGREWHRTKSGALDRCEALRQMKIEALEKQIAKLRAMKFDEEVSE